MKIAYLNSPFDTSDFNFKSGLGQSIVNQFRKLNVDVQLIGPFNESMMYFNKVKQRITPLLTGKNYYRSRDYDVISQISKKINAELKKYEFDAVFSVGTLMVPELETDKPIFIFTDAIFDSLIGLYDEYSSFCSSNLRDARLIEKNAFAKTSKLFLSSNWAKNDLLKYYDFNEKDVVLAPFGPLIEINHTKCDVHTTINNKKFDNLELLFLGGDWQRKGGKYALEITRKINESGIKCILNVVGIPKEKLQSTNTLINHGYLRKENPEQKAIFTELLQRSHFLVLPTQADTFGIVFCESNSYGLPVIASKVGGVPEVVLDGINGFVYDYPQDLNKAANTLIEYFTNKEKYLNLCYSSYLEFENRLNWDNSIQIMIKAMSDVVNHK